MADKREHRSEEGGGFFYPWDGKIEEQEREVRQRGRKDAFSP